MSPPDSLGALHFVLEARQDVNRVPSLRKEDSVRRLYKGGSLAAPAGKLPPISSSLAAFPSDSRFAEPLEADIAFPPLTPPCYAGALSHLPKRNP